MAAHHSDLDVSKTLYFDPVITWLMQIDFRWCYRNFSLTQSFWPHYGPGVNSASNRNEDQEYFLGGKGGQCVVLNLPPSCANCLEIWEPQPPGNVRTCTGLHKDCFTSHNMADSAQEDFNERCVQMKPVCDAAAAVQMVQLCVLSL